MFYSTILYTINRICSILAPCGVCYYQGLLGGPFGGHALLTCRGLGRAFARSLGGLSMFVAALGPGCPMGPGNGPL